MPDGSSRPRASDWERPGLRGVSGGTAGTNGNRALALVAVVLVQPTLRTYCLEASLRTSQSQGVCRPWVSVVCRNRRRRWLASTSSLMRSGSKRCWISPAKRWAKGAWASSVHAMTFPPPPGLVCVGFDNARAIGQAVRYLLDLGHRRVAMLAGVSQHNDRAAARIAGVRQALKKGGLTLAPQHLVERPYGLAEAREGFRLLMAAHPAPTAIVCGNDVLAFGALLEARKLGIAVPETLSIVGFDDLEMARHIQPTLTTLHVPTQQLWRTVAERVICALEGSPVQAATEVEVELVVRESSGPAPRPSRSARP